MSYLVRFGFSTIKILVIGKINCHNFGYKVKIGHFSYFLQLRLRLLNTFIESQTEMRRKEAVNSCGSPYVQPPSAAIATPIQPDQVQPEQRMETPVTVADHPLAVGATPLTTQSRAPLFNIPTPQTPYGRLLNVI